MQKPISVTEELYNQLKSMKPDDDRSFSFVIRSLIDENKRLEKENDKQKEELNTLKDNIGKWMSGTKIIED